MRTIGRFIPRKCRRLILFITVSAVTYILAMCVIWTLEQSDYQHTVLDPFGCRTSRYFADRIADRRNTHNTIAVVADVGDRLGKADMCFMLNSSKVDIQMEHVWDNVAVGYPSLVLSVTGWHDTVRVDKWTVKPLHVIIVPHSHQDPGWLHTLDQYFSQHTRSTLDLVVEQLTTHPDWRFIWAEVALLKMWWETTSDAKKEVMRRLIRTGKMELVSGGWVMTDESVSHYTAMLDQLMEGHQWLKDVLNVTIENSWSVDPFGHSSTMTYLLGQSDVQNMVIQRTHFALKRNFAADKNLEFFWRQVWDGQGSSDVFCHLMPFLSYSIPHSCGPDRHICCKFDFHKKQCFHGTRAVEILSVDKSNVAELAEQFVEQLQKKAELFRSNVLMVPHGDDFRFSSVGEWESQLGNLERIMDFINTKPEMQTKIEFGTLKDYFTLLNKHQSSKHAPRYPVLSGDMFPYSDRADQYWSGFYTTRPAFKYLVRHLQQLLRSAEILFTLSMSSVTVDSDSTELYTKLEASRRTLALVHHHDAITGTSKEIVMKDFTRRVKEALIDIIAVHTKVAVDILHQKGQKDIVLKLSDAVLEYDRFPGEAVLSGNETVNLLIWNDIGHNRQEVISVVIDSPNVEVTNAESVPVVFQISPVWESQRRLKIKEYTLSVEVNISAFSFAVFHVHRSKTLGPLSTLYNYSCNTRESEVVEDRGHFIMRHVCKDLFNISNKYINATFKSSDGMLLSVHRLGTDSVWLADIHFVTYSTGRHTHPFRDKSGPYVFLPDGIAKEFAQKPESVVVTAGSLFTEVRAIYADIVHISTLYQISGPGGKAVNIKNYVHAASSAWNNTEIVLRIETDIANRQQHFCTDTNGYQMLLRKTRAKMSIQGNFYPMTTAAMLQDEQSRFTLLSAQSQGVASLVSGWLEVILERRLLQGDWRGLNEELTDNVLTKSEFILLFETKLQTQHEESKYFCLPTALSDMLSDSINSHLKVFSTISRAWSSGSAHITKFRWLPSLPCGWHLLNARMREIKANSEVKEFFLTLHRRGQDCSVPLEDACEEKVSVNWSDFSLDISSITEMSLTGVVEKRTLSISESVFIHPMEIKTFKIAYR